MTNKPLLQVAIDVTDLKKAVRVATSAIKGEADLIEAGTPLLQKYGVKTVINVFKGLNDEIPVVADLKIADAGYLSALIAFENGADYVTVLATASTNTITGAIDAAKEYSGGVIADLILSQDVKSDIQKSLDLGVDFILIHTGLDEQSRGVNVTMKLKERTRMIPARKLAVAGGINLDNIKYVLAVSPALIIVGSAIYKAQNPEEMTKRFKQLILSSHFSSNIPH